VSEQCQKTVGPVYLTNDIAGALTPRLSFRIDAFPHLAKCDPYARLARSFLDAALFAQDFAIIGVSGLIVMSAAVWVVWLWRDIQ